MLSSSRARKIVDSLHLLPKNRYRVASDILVGRYNRHVVYDRLRDETPIERVGMMRRQERVVCSTRLVEGKWLEL